MPVYILRAGDSGPVKIGFTSQTTPSFVVDRFNALQTGNHELLQLIRLLDGGADLEQALFQRFAHLRLHRSWYRFDDAMLGDLGAPEWHRRHLIRWPTLSHKEAARVRRLREAA